MYRCCFVDLNRLFFSDSLKFPFLSIFTWQIKSLTGHCVWLMWFMRTSVQVWYIRPAEGWKRRKDGMLEGDEWRRRLTLTLGHVCLLCLYEHFKQWSCDVETLDVCRRSGDDKEPDGRLESRLFGLIWDKRRLCLWCSKIWLDFTSTTNKLRNSLFNLLWSSNNGKDISFEQFYSSETQFLYKYKLLFARKDTR